MLIPPGSAKMGSLRRIAQIETHVEAESLPRWNNKRKRSGFAPDAVTQASVSQATPNSLHVLADTVDLLSRPLSSLTQSELAATTLSHFQAAAEGRLQLHEAEKPAFFGRATKILVAPTESLQTRVDVAAHLLGAIERGVRPDPATSAREVLAGLYALLNTENLPLAESAKVLRGLLRPSVAPALGLSGGTTQSLQVLASRLIHSVPLQNDAAHDSPWMQMAEQYIREYNQRGIAPPPKLIDMLAEKFTRPDFPLQTRYKAFLLAVSATKFAQNDPLITEPSWRPQFLHFLAHSGPANLNDAQAVLLSNVYRRLKQPVAEGRTPWAGFDAAQAREFIASAAPFISHHAMPAATRGEILRDILKYISTDGPVFTPAVSEQLRDAALNHLRAQQDSVKHHAFMICALGGKNVRAALRFDEGHDASVIAATNALFGHPQTPEKVNELLTVLRLHGLLQNIPCRPETDARPYLQYGLDILKNDTLAASESHRQLSVAVVKLVEAGELKLDDEVFAAIAKNGIAGHFQCDDARLARYTVILGNAAKPGDARSVPTENRIPAHEFSVSEPPMLDFIRAIAGRRINLPDERKNVLLEDAVAYINNPYNTRKNRSAMASEIINALPSHSLLPNQMQKTVLVQRAVELIKDERTPATERLRLAGLIAKNATSRTLPLTEYIPEIVDLLSNLAVKADLSPNARHNFMERLLAIADAKNLRLSHATHRKIIAGAFSGMAADGSKNRGLAAGLLRSLKRSTPASTTGRLAQLDELGTSG